MSTDKLFAEIRQLESKTNKLYDQVLKEVFKEYPTIKSFSIDLKSEYDDNNDYMVSGIQTINGVDLPELLTDSYVLEELEDLDNEYSNADEWNKFLMASKIKIETLAAFLDIINSIPTRYFENECSSLDFKQEEKKPRKEKKSAKSAS